MISMTERDIPDKQGRVGAAKGGRPKGATKYSPEIIDQALLALAYTRRAKEAHEQLKIAGITPTPSIDTLKRWRDEFAPRLAELTEKHGAEIEKHTVGNYLDVVAKAVAASSLLVDKTLEQAEAGNLRDPASSAQKMAITAGIFQDKILVIQGKPTSIVGHKSGEEALRTLARKYAPPVDSTATEESPKELES